MYISLILPNKLFNPHVIFQPIRVKSTDGIKKNPVPWYDVAMTTNTSIVVSHYYVPVGDGDIKVICCYQCHMCSVFYFLQFFSLASVNVNQNVAINVQCRYVNANVMSSSHCAHCCSFVFIDYRHERSVLRLFF